MSDVAKAAGVSTMTVSYALRHHPRIPEETAERVRGIAQELGYTVSPLVSAFITEIRHRKKTKAPPSIGYLSMYKRRDIWRHTSFEGAHFEGAQARCQELNFRLNLIEPAISGLSGKRLTDVLLYNNYHGLIIATVPTTGERPNLDWDRLPLVSLGYTLTSPELHRVEINHFQAMQLALQKLTQLGYRRIALATFHQSSSRIGDQYLAAAEIFQRKLPSSQRIPMLIGSYSSMTAEKVKRWIDRYNPDVLMDAGQRRYATLLEKAGLRFPQDIGYAVSNWTSACVGLSGINQHPFQIGAAAVDILVKQIYGNQRGIPDHRTVTLLDASWVDGGSTPVRSSGPEESASRNW